MKYISISQATKKAVSFALKKFDVFEFVSMEVLSAYRDADAPTGKYENVTFSFVFCNRPRHIYGDLQGKFITVYPDGTALITGKFDA